MKGDHEASSADYLSYLLFGSSRLPSQSWLQAFSCFSWKKELLLRCLSGRGIFNTSGGLCFWPQVFFCC
jgi:hypothetical protein